MSAVASDRCLPCAVLVCLGVPWLGGALVDAEETRQDFRRRFDRKLFRAVGPHAPRMSDVHSDGIRITLPAKSESATPSGITHLGLRGDFEISLAFAVDHVERPTTGHGAGVSLWISSVSGGNDSATISWVRRSGGETVFASHHAVTSATGQRRHASGPSTPTDLTSGVLRLIRKQSMLVYLAGGSETSLREIYRTDVGAGDLATIRFAADNGGSPTRVDLRLLWVKLRAEEFGFARRPDPPAQWPWQWIIGGGVPILFGIGVWYARRRPPMADHLAR